MRYLTSFIALWALLWPGLSTAQVVSVTPVYPTLDDTVTVIFDASLGNGALAGVAPVYAHAGLITTTSTSPSDWKYVIGNWGTADSRVAMESLGNNRWRLKYHLRTFHGVPSGVDALQMSFVFRNQAGTIVGRSSTGGDIYYDMKVPGPLQIRFLLPENRSELVDQGVTRQVKAIASEARPMQLFVNGTSVASIPSGQEIDYSFAPTSGGSYEIVAEATVGAAAFRDTTYFVVRGPVVVQDPAPGILPGVNYLNDTTVVLALEAPGKQYVYAIGDFSGWLPTPETYMKRSQNGDIWWVELTGLTAGLQYGYQYLVDGNLRIGDPYAELVLDPDNDRFISSTTYPNLKPYPTGQTNGIVSVFETAQQPFPWTDQSFVRPANRELMVYELHIRDFVAAHDYKTVMDSLDYLQRMGINCIELMPIMEFEGNNSWGYNPSYCLAVDKYYGTRNDLRTFINECHNRGIAVVLDMVLNHHFGQSPLVRLYWDAQNNKPAANSPWFNPDATHPFNVGYDFNHESPYTQRYVDRVMRWWVEEYHFDGYRMDLSKGFTQTNNPNNVGAWGNYDQSRINLLQRMGNALWAIDPGVYIILEHFAANNEETVLANNGFMLWSNHVHNYNEATMGYLSGSDFSWISYKNKGWNQPHAVGYMESHDEERLMYKNLQFGNSNASYNTKDLNTALARMELASTFFFTVPGPKMVWQFGELGYDVSIDFNGRTGEKPIRWNYLQNAYRLKLYKVYSALINLRLAQDAFNSTDFTMAVGGNVAVKRIHVNDASMNVTAIGNFDIVQQSGAGNFQHTGWWYNFFTGDSINVTATNQSITLAPGEYRLYTDVKLAKPDVALSAEPGQDFWTASGYPNPFSEQFTIAYDLPATSAVRIDIIDLQGRLIRVLTNGEVQAAGIREAQWDGRDASGRMVPNGLYLYRISAGDQSASGKCWKE